MLGYEIFVYRMDLIEMPEKPASKDPALLAHWTVGLGGLDWLRELVRQGKAEFEGNSGYPERFIVAAKYILPVLKAGVPRARSPLVIGDDYVMPPNWIGDAVLHEDRIAACPAEQLLRIDAWDQS